jgi:hypothetical protein
MVKMTCSSTSHLSHIQKLEQSDICCHKLTSTLLSSMFFVPLHLVGLLLRVVHLSPVHLDRLHLQLEICEGLEEAARVRRVSWCGGGGYSKKRKKVDVWRMMVASRSVYSSR